MRFCNRNNTLLHMSLNNCDMSPCSYLYMLESKHQNILMHNELRNLLYIRLSNHLNTRAYIHYNNH